MPLPGAIIGALVSVKISDVWFQRILAIVMIGIVVSMFIPQTRKAYENDVSTIKNKWLIYAVMFCLGFYGGFIQVGVGFVLIATLFYFLQTSLLRVNVYKLIIVIVYTVPVLLIFILNNKIHWLAGLTLAGGNSAGAWLAAHISVKKGDKFIKYILAFVILIMAVKLWY